MDKIALQVFREELEKAAFFRQLATPHAEHVGDLAGLGMMAASSADKLKSQLQHPGDEERGSLMGGTAGRTGADLAGLAVMTAPTLASMRYGEGASFRNVANLAGLAALTAPTLDKLQANIRAKRDNSDPEKKMLMGHKAHAAAELAGYGALMAPVIGDARRGMHASHALTLGGYGALAAPVVADLAHEGGLDPKEKLQMHGAARTTSELAGLGLLAGGALAGRGGHG